METTASVPSKWSAKKVILWVVGIVVLIIVVSMIFSPSSKDAFQQGLDSTVQK
jgi:hypothetical protein